MNGPQHPFPLTQASPGRRALRIAKHSFSWTFRVDHTISSKQRMFVRGSAYTQRELPGGFVAEAAYVGNRGTHIEINRNLNVTSQKYLSKSPVRDQATFNYLTANVANPFFGVTLPAGANEKQKTS